MEAREGVGQNLSLSMVSDPALALKVYSITAKKRSLGLHHPAGNPPQARTCMTIGITRTLELYRTRWPWRRKDNLHSHGYVLCLSLSLSSGFASKKKHKVQLT